MTINELKRPDFILSIIIPVYNAEPFLRRCLESVVSQINDRVQVIVIDDCSEDNSSDIIDEFGMMISEYRINETHSGVSISRSKGLRLATGDYITFLDADDELADGAIKTMLALAELAKINGTNIMQLNHYRKYEGIDGLRHKYDNKPSAYNLNNLPLRWQFVWNKLYSRDFIYKHGLLSFKDGMQFGEDELYNLDCLRHCQSILCVDKFSVIKHFDNPKSLCHTVNKPALIDLCCALMAKLLENNTPEYQRAVRAILADHWRSNLFISSFGGDEK